MGFLDNLLGSKIILKPDIIAMAEKLITNEWFSHCGAMADFETKFSITLAKDLDEVNKKLTYKRDIKSFVTLDNLLLEAGRRSQLFLSLHYKNQYGNTWNKLTDVIFKAYLSNYKFDFNKLEQDFNTRFNLHTNLYLKKIFTDILKEMYFKDLITDFPTFFTDIAAIYLNGNVVIGWSGKFGSHNIQVKEIFPISPAEGVLNIW